MPLPFAAVLASLPLTKILAGLSASLAVAKQSKDLFEKTKSRRTDPGPATKELIDKIMELVDNDIQQAELISQQAELISQQAEAIHQLAVQNEAFAQSLQILAVRAKQLAFALLLVSLLAIAALIVQFL